MSQQNIWDYYQTEGLAHFAANSPRLDYLFHKVKSLAKKSNISILNIGPGNGYFESRCIADNYSVIALDPSEKTIENLKQRKIAGVTASIAAIPFPAEQFDFVVASEVLEHIPDPDFDLGIQEVLRVLKPQGWFLGTVPYREKLSDNQTVCPNCSEQFHRWGHVRSFGQQDLTVALAKIGHSLNVERRTFVDWKQPGLGRFIKNIFKWQAGKLGEAMADPHFVFRVQK